MEILNTAIIFIFSLSILVGIHEMGHYLAARISGVKVVQYSIGFGPRLLKWKSKKSGILYTFSVIPLGGFVKMLTDSEVENEKSEHYQDKSLTFDKAPLWNRFWITFWGPLTNGILAIVLLTYIGTGPKFELPAILGETYGIAKEVGFKEKDIVKSINGKETEDWTGFMLQLAMATGQKEALFEVSRDGKDLSLTADLSSVKISRDNPNYDYELGFHFAFEPGNKIDKITSGGPADKSGLLPNDRIVKINEVSTPKLTFLTHELSKHKGKNVDLEIIRNGNRESKVVEVPNEGKIGIGLKNDVDIEEIKKLSSVRNVGIVESISNSVEKTYNMSVVTLKFIWKIIVNETSVSSLSGPVSMAKTTESGFANGIDTYLFVLAMLSINLMVLNLLPIPVLDGGHIAFNLIEAAFGPVPKKAQEYVTTAFGCLLMAFMLSITLYDIYKTVV